MDLSKKIVIVFSKTRRKIISYDAYLSIKKNKLVSGCWHVKIKDTKNKSLTIDKEHIDVFTNYKITLNECYYCGSEKDLTKDHFYPKSKGGKFTITACLRCNRYKANLTPLKFINKHINNQVKSTQIIINRTLELLSRTNLKKD